VRSSTRLALRVTDSLLRAERGIVRLDGPGRDGHAVVAVGSAQFLGHDDLDGVQPGTRFACIRNSWSPQWGIGGYALRAQEAMTECVVGAFIIEPITANIAT
jgi:hypothetical protein